MCSTQHTCRTIASSEPGKLMLQVRTPQNTSTHTYFSTFSHTSATSNSLKIQTDTVHVFTDYMGQELSTVCDNTNIVQVKDVAFSSFMSQHNAHVSIVSFVQNEFSYVKMAIKVDIMMIHGCGIDLKTKSGPGLQTHIPPPQDDKKSCLGVHKNSFKTP